MSHGTCHLLFGFLAYAGVSGCSNTSHQKPPPVAASKARRMAPPKKEVTKIYSVRVIRIELVRQPDGKKYPHYLKESYDLTSDSALRYFGYFGGVPLGMNHTDSARWSAGGHGERVLAAVRSVVGDPGLFAELKQIPDEGENPCSRGMYTVGLTRHEADVDYCVPDATRAFSIIDKAFLELIAEFERRNGRPLTPDKLPQRGP
jgi:hypothetical protein